MATSAGRVVHRSWFDPESDTELGVVVVRALAAVEDADPTEVDFRLHDSIDVDALAKMYRHADGRPGSPWRMEFTVHDRHVSVRDDGRITVR